MSPSCPLYVPIVPIRPLWPLWDRYRQEIELPGPCAELPRGETLDLIGGAGVLGGGSLFTLRACGAAPRRDE